MIVEYNWKKQEEREARKRENDTNILEWGLQDKGHDRLNVRKVFNGQVVVREAGNQAEN